MHVEHGAPGGAFGPAADQGRHHWALVIPAQLDDVPLVGRAKHVRFHPADGTPAGYRAVAPARPHQTDEGCPLSVAHGLSAGGFV
ncbi:hypothetical protein Van01_60610 [Micromonospora andamanensis]|uniref:Uncharacterized protein n=1 Tax=Micromonospora andamanensis TaxID=1287068 RepID=A0ABQ4I4N1_9ACTN|nr:hypothetical protein Van01_60610 [Micromonospora andamanensis]